jgi:hypothetical protein
MAFNCGIGNRILNATRVTTFISFHREKCQKRHQKLFFLFYFTMCYIFLRNISKFQEKRFINNYLITNY